MLLKFKFSNWASFKNEAEFSMLGTLERQHQERVPRLKRHGGRKVLPIASLYGGNASGKTKFIQAMAFARDFVVEGVGVDAVIPVKPYRPADDSAPQPSRFEFLILVDEDVYGFSFGVNAKRVVSERLFKMKGDAEVELYSRSLDEIVLGNDLEDPPFLKYAAKGTRENQLFLNNAVMQKGLQFLPVFDWFRNQLEIITPDSRYLPVEQFFQPQSPLCTRVQESLSQLDTGITRLRGIPVPWGNLPISDEERERLEKVVQEGAVFRTRLHNEVYVVRRTSGQLTAEKMVAIHVGKDGSETPFDMSWESDGTLRVIDLLPAFFTMGEKASRKVFLIDELDRSLHPSLTRHLVETYLAGITPDSRTQIIFTTHDVQLMDQKIFRRDEMWAMERSRFDGSVLIPFSDFNSDIRYDKDIRKSYLQGRMGGVPQISGKLAFGSVAEETGGVK